MRLNRRLFALSTLTPAMSDIRPGTPEASTPETSLVAMTPEDVFEMLLATPFASPLLPTDSGDVVVSEWIDGSDSDLDGAVGGLLFGGSAEGEEASLGAMIVYQDEATEKGRVDEDTFEPGPSETANSLSVGGAAGITVVNIDSPGEVGSDDYSHATSVVSFGFVAISGGAEGVAHEELELRSVANVVALLDHFRRVVTSIQT